MYKPDMNGSPGFMVRASVDGGDAGRDSMVRIGGGTSALSINFPTGNNTNPSVLGIPTTSVALNKQKK